MPNGRAPKGPNSDKRLAAIDQLLIAGIKQGPAKKKDAINRVLQFVPQWTRRDCWQRIRKLRQTSELVGPQPNIVRRTSFRKKGATGEGPKAMDKRRR